MSYFTRKNDKECKGSSPSAKVVWLAIDVDRKVFTKIEAQTFVEAKQKAVAKLNNNETFIALMCDYREI